jgi:CheY-like chemotaxis protein
VEAVSDGEDALFVAAMFEPDAIVMDLRLPVVGGLEATRRLKRDSRTKHVPIVVCTGLTTLPAEIQARSAGCDEFVAKPCAPESLRELLENMIVGSPRPA